MSVDLSLPEPCYVCRCEELTELLIREAVRAGATTVDEVKRMTRSGMGACQGLFCSDEIARILSMMVGPDAEVAPFLTFRPPARQITLAALASAADEQAVDRDSID